MNLNLKVWFSLYRYAAALFVLFIFLPVVRKAHAYMKGISWVNKMWKAKYRWMFLAATHDLLFLLYKITESNKKNLMPCGTLLCGEDLCKELIDPSSFSKPVFASIHIQISVVLLQPLQFSVLILIHLICPDPL